MTTPMRSAAASLRWKMLAFVLAISTSFVAGTWAMQRLIVQPEFAAIEERDAETNVSRVLDAIDSDAASLARTAQDYAAWDDSLHYIQERNADFITANFVASALENLGTSFALITDERGSLVWSGRSDAEAGELVADPAWAAEILERRGLFSHESADSKKHGMLRTERGVVLVGSAAITSTNRDTPPAGSVAFVRMLDSERVAAIAEQLHLAMTVTPLDSLDDAGRRAAVELARHDRWSDVSSEETLIAYSYLRDTHDEPVLLLRVTLKRETSQRAAAAARLTAAVGAVGGLALLGAMWIVLARLVLNPLGRLTSHALSVGASGDLGARLGLASNDEIGTLAGEFDAMVEQLERSRAQLVDVAHQAGRAEIAAAVLHDIGNVLNSATVSASVVADALTRSELHSLRRVTDLLRENAQQLPAFLTSDPRGQHVLPFLEELAGELETEQQRALGEMKTLGSVLEHVATLVRAQNRNTHAKPFLELLDPGELAKQAAAITGESFARHHIALALHAEPGERALIDRHRCLQVLTNLLANAKNAIRAANRGAGTVSQCVSRVSDASGEWIEFAVRDDGSGIAAQDLERIFALGFSTREDGQGIGLHSAANLAREMGGSLRAESDGPGRGAAFVLRIPARREAAQ